MNRKALAIATIFCALGLFPLLAVVLENPFLIRIGTRVMIFSIAVIALDLSLGFGGMISLCSAAFMGLGAYIVAIFSWHAANSEPINLVLFSLPGSDNALIVWPVAVIITAAVAFVVGFLSLRTSGVYFIMITLAFNQMIYFLFVGLRPYGGLDGLDLASTSRLPFIDISNRYIFYYFVLACLIASLFFCSRMVRSRFGAVLSGARQNDRRMRSIGRRTFWYRLVAFTITGAICGFAGVLLVNANQYVSPTELSWMRSAELLAMVIVGGIGTLVGPILGAATYLLLMFYMSEYTEHWEAVFGIFLMLTILLTSRGLYSLFVPPAESRHA